jgi:hypothetical protein
METAQHPGSNEIGSAASRTWEEIATPERWSDGHLARRARGGPEEGKELLPPPALPLEQAGERTRLTAEEELGFRPCPGGRRARRARRAGALAALARAATGRRGAAIGGAGVISEGPGNALGDEVFTRACSEAENHPPTQGRGAGGASRRARGAARRRARTRHPRASGARTRRGASPHVGPAGPSTLNGDRHPPSPAIHGRGDGCARRPRQRPGIPSSRPM